MTRKKIAFSVLYFAAFTIGMLVCAKKGLLCYEIESGNGAAYEQKAESVAYGYAIEQTIVPQYDRIAIVKVYVDLSDRQQESGRLQATLTDAAGTVAAVTAVEIAQMPQNGWCELALDAQVKAGETYTLSLETLDCPDFGPRLSFYSADVAASAEEEGGIMRYAGSEVTNAALRMKLIYRVPAAWYAYALYYLCAGVVWSMGMEYWNKKECS